MLALHRRYLSRTGVHRWVSPRLGFHPQQQIATAFTAASRRNDRVLQSLFYCHGDWLLSVWDHLVGPILHRVLT